MSGIKKHIVSCGGFGVGLSDPNSNKIILEHRKELPNYNTRIKLDKLINTVLTVRARHKDLLNIAGYLFAADRKISRGRTDAQEYHSWSRYIILHIGVRDYSFWNQPGIKKLLADALEFMTGDIKYEFSFYQSDEDFPSSIFDNDNFNMQKEDKLKVLLFSGGIDSLAGAVEILEDFDGHLCLVSHRSGHATTISIQNKLFNQLQQFYPGRVSHYKFECGLSKESTVEESQRTRSFLYTSTAFVVAEAYGQKEIYVHENGITSLNFAETQDLMNARSSRTTHPKTLALLENLFTAVAEKSITIKNNFFDRTKTDVIKILKKYERSNLFMSSISCSSTRNNTSAKTHCGKCSQCVDRRFASFAAEIDTWDDSSNYDFDFLKDSLTDDLALKTLLEFIRMAQNFRGFTLDGFFLNYGPELADIIPYINGKSDEERVSKIYKLCQNHSTDIEHAINQMQMKFDKPLAPAKPNSFFTLIIRPRAYQKIANPIKIHKTVEDTTREERERNISEQETAYNLIKKLKKKNYFQKHGLTKDKLLKIIDEKCRKNNGAINFKKLGNELGCSNHTAKKRCMDYNIL